MSDLISRRTVIDMVEGWNLNQHIMNEEDALDDVKALPSAESDVAENLHQCKCYITDKKGLQHEVIYIDDIRRVTGWTI